MQRFTVFAKGNVDVRDTLVAQRVAGRVTWNGINEVLRERAFPCTVRVRHETLARTDLLLAAGEGLAQALEGREFELGPHSIAAQSSQAIFTAPADAYVLSIQADFFTNLVRHRESAALFHAHGSRAWPAPDHAWLRERFEPLPLLSADEAMASMERVIARLRERTQAPILIYNLSAVMPGNAVHCYAGLGETYLTRAMRFNLALVDLSRRTGISVIDVDQVVARAGADHCKVDQVHFNATGCKAVAEEVVRVLADLGVFDAVETP